MVHSNGTDVSGVALDGTRWRRASGETPTDSLALGMTAERDSGRVLLLTGHFGPSGSGMPFDRGELWSWSGAGSVRVSADACARRRRVRLE